jgi:multiple sugar transport system ATP-binding protein
MLPLGDSWNLYGNLWKLPTGNITCQASQEYGERREICRRKSRGKYVASIRLEGVDKVYENGFHAVHELSLDVNDGEFLVLVGPSGCGKSTALRMIAGLENITGGRLFIGNDDVTALEPKDRDIAMVFQSYALYPHLTVRDNIAFALKLRKMPKAEITQRVEEAARILELTDNLDRRPGQLSGGQRQRVAMGRAIVRQPRAFLMDEPLSNLDAKLRVQMRAEISHLQQSLKTTTVYVTHDQIEAMTMGDRVAVMSAGHLQQVDSPQNLYDFPANLFVAGFIGSPQMNIVEGTVVRRDDGFELNIGGQRLAIPDSVTTARPALARYEGATVAVGIRPEHVDDAQFAETGEELQGIVEVREGLGSEVILHLAIDAKAVDRTGAERAPRFLARANARTTLRAGEIANMRVDASQLHLFDLESGLAIRS